MLEIGMKLRRGPSAGWYSLPAALSSFKPKKKNGRVTCVWGGAGKALEGAKTLNL